MIEDSMLLGVNWSILVQSTVSLEVAQQSRYSKTGLVYVLLCGHARPLSHWSWNLAHDADATLTHDAKEPFSYRYR
jgi:hypothetical protein